MIKNKIPVPSPTTLTAILPNQSGTPTEHVYTETRECIVDKEPAYEYIFKCLDTGAERRWGLVDRFEFGGVAN